MDNSIKISVKKSLDTAWKAIRMTYLSSICITAAFSIVSFLLIDVPVFILYPAACIILLLSFIMGALYVLIFEITFSNAVIHLLLLNEEENTGDK